MSHEILSAKLYELDREFGLLHGSIQLSETAAANNSARSWPACGRKMKRTVWRSRQS